MSYISDRIADGYRRAAASDGLKQIVDAGIILPSGLYFAAAGAPSYSFNQDGSHHTAPASSSPTRNVIEWATRGDKVIVRGEGVKSTVSLYPPTNGQHSERYVLTNLRFIGLTPTSAIVKKIAKELDRLRKQRRT